MPYASWAQAAKFHEMERRGEISPEVVAEFDKASRGRRLPQRVTPEVTHWHPAKIGQPKRGHRYKP